MKRTADNLAPLLGLLNDPKVTGAVVEDEATPMPPDPVFDAVPAKAATAQPAAEPISRKPLLSRIFLTGKLKSGKDHVLNAAGFKILGLADPIYELANYFFPGQPKDHTREFLQKAGQFGRGEISETYSLSIERALFVSMIRSLAGAGAFKSFSSIVDWDSYGRNPEIWLEALLRRAEAEPEARIGISNVRFQNEKSRLEAAGFVGFHVLSSPQTWLLRLKKSGIDANSPVVKDLSERLAVGLDNAVYKTLSQHRGGHQLRCVWSDEAIAPPSPRLLTVEQFKRQVGL